jgi:hypothetical protein
MSEKEKYVGNCLCSGSSTDRSMYLYFICFSFVIVSLEAKRRHCRIRGKSLAIKYVPPQLRTNSAKSVKTANFIKARVLKFNKVRLSA